jgi:hypothetical protein
MKVGRRLLQIKLHRHDGERHRRHTKPEWSPRVDPSVQPNHSGHAETRIDAERCEGYHVTIEPSAIARITYPQRQAPSSLNARSLASQA